MLKKDDIGGRYMGRMDGWVDGKMTGWMDGFCRMRGQNDPENVCTGGKEGELAGSLGAPQGFQFLSLPFYLSSLSRSFSLSLSGSEDQLRGRGVEGGVQTSTARGRKRAAARPLIQNMPHTQS